MTVRANALTLADAVIPFRDAGGVLAALRAIALVIGGAALTAIAAQLSFKLPWTEVPYTAQTAAVLLTGTVLGARLGAASMLLYLAVGALGAPVYSAGAHGLDQLFGYTAGYLAGFVVAAALVGYLAERGWDRTPVRAAGLMALGNLVIYAIGVPVLIAVLSLPITDAIQGGALVFLPWDAFKVLVAAGLLPLAWRLVGREERAS